MRVYLPTTLAGLATAYADGAFAAPLEGHAVTGAVLEWYVSGDLEELEYAAFTEAVEASLRRLAAHGNGLRRVVVAADVPDVEVRPRDDERFRSAVLVSAAGALRAGGRRAVREGEAPRRRPPPPRP